MENEVARIVSPETVRRVRMRDGVCLAGLMLKDGCSGGVDVHHIASRGAGGDDTLENMICLCRKHHHQAHAGILTRGRLRAVLRFYWQYRYSEAELAEQ